MKGHDDNITRMKHTTNDDETLRRRCGRTLNNGSSLFRRVAMPMIIFVCAVLNVASTLRQSISLFSLRTTTTTATNNAPLIPAALSSTEEEEDEFNIYYHLPPQPMTNVHAILKESIGTNILNNPKTDPLRYCAPTVQYRLIIPKKNQATATATATAAPSYWILQSMRLLVPPPTDTTTTTNNNDTATPAASVVEVVPKIQGGDELYVQWEADHHDDDDDDYMGVAQITDQNDGTYRLTFVRPPMLQFNYTRRRRRRHAVTLETTTTSSSSSSPPPFGRLTIYYEYTCGIGRLFSPRKNYYARAGEVFQTLTTTTFHSTSWKDEYDDDASTATTERLVPRPIIHDFVPPNTIESASTTTTSTSSSNTNTTANLIDLSQYDTVFAFGDSLIMQLVRRYLRKGEWSNNIVWHKNVYQCLSTDQEAQSMIWKFHTRHGDHIRNLTVASQRIALLTGTASWDAMRGCVREDLQDHLSAIRTYLTNITTSFPNVDIYWKSPSAFFLHRYTTYLDAFNDTYFRTLTSKYGVKPMKPRFINYHVPQQLYRAQKEMMRNEFQIPFLDLYDSYYLSAPWTVPGDARHFQDELTRLQLSYFWPGLLDKPIYE